MTGDLTVKGVTKQVTCRMEAPTAILRDDQSNLDMVGFRGSMTIDRRDFGLSGIPQMDALFRGSPRVSNEVLVRFSFGAFRYTLDYLEARFHSKSQDGSMHPVGTLYDLARQEGISAALSAFDKMKSETPDRIDKNTLPDLGWFLMVSGHPQEAIQAYRKSFEDHPDFWTAHMRMGDAYVLAGQREKAIQTYSNVREHFEFHPHLEELLRLLQR